MREIKFRAWDSEHNKIVDDVYAHSFYKSLNECLANSIIMQYTGMKDKNGKEIYEGDLFGKFGGDEDRPNEYEVHGQVKWDDDFAMFTMELTNGGWMQLFDYFKESKSEKEIIGNIYENPELITNQ